ncbi:hypothetical protein GCM10027269_17220 [Kribbella endophytica]
MLKALELGRGLRLGWERDRGLELDRAGPGSGVEVMPESGVGMVPGSGVGMVPGSGGGMVPGSGVQIVELGSD